MCWLPSAPNWRGNPYPYEDGLKYREKRTESGSCPSFPASLEKNKIAKFQLLFPSMAGVLTAVRITLSPQKREQMLMEARDFFYSTPLPNSNFFILQRVRSYSFTLNTIIPTLGGEPMKFMIPFLMAGLPIFSSAAQSQSQLRGRPAPPPVSLSLQPPQCW